MSKGIDIPIDELFSLFNANLWVGKQTAFNGRAFRNERFENGKISPEIWISPNDYIEVLKDNTKDAQCFFDVQPDIDITKDVHRAKVWLCVMVNLAAVYPSMTRTEATEQVHSDVKRLVLNSQFEIDGLMTGFAGFETYDWGQNDAQNLVNMSPHYLFRYNLIVTYTNSCN
jgi:hypothetical protein